MGEEAVQDLRAWARGSYAAEAAVEMLARAFGGRFAAPGWPWIVAPGEERGGNMRSREHWLDAEELLNAASTGPLSGGERTYLRLVAGMFGQAHVDLSDVAGLDRDLQAMVLAGLSHAGGAHQHPRTVTGEHTDAASGETFTATIPVPGQYARALFPWQGDDVPLDDPPAGRDQAGGTAAPGRGTRRICQGRGVEHQKQGMPRPAPDGSRLGR